MAIPRFFPVMVCGLTLLTPILHPDSAIATMPQRRVLQTIRIFSMAHLAASR